MPNKTPGLAAIYARISEDRESEERGIERQIEDCRAKAKAHGLTVVEPPFVDNDISASTRSAKKRPAYDDMLERAKRGEFSTIIAYSNSRITRRPRELEDLIELNKQYGTVIRTVVSGDDDLSLADGRMTARIKASVDAGEAEKVAERVKRAVDQRKAKGEYHGSSAPFGFKLTGRKQLAHEPHEVEMIHEAVSRLLDANDTLYSIVRDWNAAGKFTRATKRFPNGNRWRHETLRTALTNPALIARTRPVVTKGRAPRAARGYPAQWEPILDEQTFDAICDRLIDPARSKANPTGKKSSKYTLGSGLTVCGRCGMALVVVKRKDQPLKLACKPNSNGNHENHPIDPATGFSTGRVTIGHDMLEQYVFARFEERLNDDAYWQTHKNDPDPKSSEKIAALEREKDAERAKIRRAEDRAFDGLIDPQRLRVKIDETRARIREIDAEIGTLKGKPSLRDNAKTALGGGAEAILASRENFPPDVKRTLLKLLIEKIVVNEWPAGLPMTASMRSGETLEAFEERRRELWEEGLRKRVFIKWRED